MKLGPAARDALAAGYVIGTLRGPARARLERKLDADAALRVEVERWEDRLQPLADRVAPVEPSPSAWTSLAQRLGFDRVARPAPRWGWAAALAAGVVAAVGALLWQPVVDPLRFVPDVQVEIAGAQGPFWRIEADTRRGKLEVAALDDVTVEAGKSLELWLIRPGDQAPVSLGLMPVRLGERAELRAATPLAAGLAFAVSLEPRGGSPTGLPTGPVLHVKEFARA